jgi:hypothetical protein
VLPSSHCSPVSIKKLPHIGAAEVVAPQVMSLPVAFAHTLLGPFKERTFLSFKIVALVKTAKL